MRLLLKLEPPIVVSEEEEVVKTLLGVFRQ
jgi:hypothetical protein